jgi:hypothetical protein
MNRKSLTTLISGLSRKNSVAKLARPKTKTRRSRKKIIAPILDFMSDYPFGADGADFTSSGGEAPDGIKGSTQRCARASYLIEGHGHLRTSLLSAMEIAPALTK